MSIEPYLKLMSKQQASDMYFTTGAPVNIRINGTMQPVGRKILAPSETQSLAFDLLTPSQTKEFKHNLELNIGISYTNLGRFRINIYQQRGEVSMVIRYIKAEIPEISTLGLPSVYKSLIMKKKGLILVVGATGSGKSTSLASMIEYRNRLESGHIITIEDPIEYMFQHKKCIIGQREVGLDTHSFSSALREAMREAPDVVMIGEARDRETMESAIRVADTGHLCLTTLHATNASQTLDRLLNFFNASERKQILADLALNLNAILAQRLVKTANGTRVVVAEVMVNTPYISKLIREGDFYEIKDIMEKGNDSGMKSFDQSLFDLYKANRIDLKSALANADSSSELEWKINFGGGTGAPSSSSTSSSSTDTVVDLSLPN